MSADRFLSQVEKLGIVDEKILGKVRKQVANPEKNVSAKAVAKYLIDKGQLTKAQSQRLLTDLEDETLPVGATKHDELVESQPVDNPHDTDQLISVDAPDDSPAPSDATRMDFDQAHDQAEDEIIEVELDEVHEVAVEQIEAIENTMGQAFSKQPAAATAAPAMDLFDDPFADQMHADDSGEQSLVGFAGKKTAKKDPWKSRWLFIAPTIIGVLGILAVLLWFYFSKQNPDELWKAANQAHIRGDFGVAMEHFDQFIKDYPKDDRHELALVYRVRSSLAQAFSSKQWDETYRRATERLPEIEQNPQFNEIREALADILPNTTLGFANQALKENDIPKKRKILEKATECKKLVETPSYIPTSLLTRPITEKVIDEIEDKLRQIRREITMEEVYVRVLDDIHQMIDEGDTNDAIEAYQDLTNRFPKLRPREELQKAVAQASEAERENVKAITPDWQPTNVDPDSLIAKTVILARQSGTTAVGLEDKMIPFLVDGSVYMFRGGDGSIAWRRFVGYQTHNAPQWLDVTQRRLLVTNAESNLLSCLETATGNLVWQQKLDGPFHQPKVIDGSVIVTTQSGQVIRFNSNDGTIAAAVQLPQQTSVACEANSAFVYQPGYHTNLYVLSTADLSCVGVNFVGPDHREGTIGVPPIMTNGYLILMVNGGDYANLHAYRIEENGQKLTEAQFENRFTQGTVNTPMHRLDPRIILASDTGDMKLLAINKAEGEDPVSVAASFGFSVDNSIATQMKMAGMQHFVMAHSGRVWIGNRGLMRFRVRVSQQSFNRDLITNGKDNFLAPMVRIGDYALTARRREGSALVSVAAIDPLSSDHKEVWRTDFSAPMAGSVIKEGDNHFVVSSQGDIFPLTQSVTDNGYLGKPTTLGSTIIDNLLFTNNIELGPGKRVFYGPFDRTMILSVDTARTTGATRLVELMAPADTPSCEPIPFGDHIIIASRKGQVVRTNPGSGQPAGTPFQPEVEPGKDIRWCRPAKIDDSRLVIADGDAGILYLLQVTAKDIQRQDTLEHLQRIHSPLVKVGNQVVVVDFDGNAYRLVAFTVGQSIEEQPTTLELPSDYVAGPFLFESGVLVQLASNEIAFYEASQFAQGSDSSEPKWKLPLNGESLAGPPTKVGDDTVFAFSNGNLAVVNSETGERTKTISLGQPIFGTPTVSESNMLIGGRDGNVHIVPIDALK